jgi:hypothetical protein
LVIALCFGLGDIRLVAFQWPVGPLSGVLTMTVCYCASIHASGFYRGYKNPGCVLVVATWCFIIAGETLLHFQQLSLFAFDNFGELSFLEFSSPSRRLWLVAVLLVKPLPI